MSLTSCCCCTVTFGGHFYHVCSTTGVEAGDTVTVKDHTTGTVLWTGTTDSAGAFSGSFSPPSGTSFNVDFVGTSVSGGAFPGDTVTVNRALGCGSNTATNLQAVRMSVRFPSTGCNGLGVDGVTVSYAGPVSGSCTTSGAIGPTAGTCTVTALPAGTYTWSATGTRWATNTGTFVINNCSQGHINGVLTAPSLIGGVVTLVVPLAMTPDSGYVCFCGCYAYPVLPSLNGSFSGEATGAFVFTGGGGVWSGTVTLTFPPDANSAGQNRAATVTTAATVDCNTVTFTTIDPATGAPVQVICPGPGHALSGPTCAASGPPFVGALTWAIAFPPTSPCFPRTLTLVAMFTE